MCSRAKKGEQSICSFSLSLNGKVFLNFTFQRVPLSVKLSHRVLSVKKISAVILLDSYKVDLVYQFKKCIFTADIQSSTD